MPQVTYVVNYIDTCVNDVTIHMPLVHDVICTWKTLIYVATTPCNFEVHVINSCIMTRGTICFSYDVIYTCQALVVLEWHWTQNTYYLWLVRVNLTSRNLTPVGYIRSMLYTVTPLIIMIDKGRILLTRSNWLNNNVLQVSNACLILTFCYLYPWMTRVEFTWHV